MKLMKFYTSPLFDLPTPFSINLFWNFGFILGFITTIQVISGLFLSMLFIPSESDAFFSIIHIMRDSNSGWFIRLIHSNVASLIFLCVYIHLARGLYTSSFKTKSHAWNSGVTIFIIVMAAAFFGYVLPWGQMSYWGATVITNIASAIPYIGIYLVKWMWGNFSVSQPTLNRFFSIHFIVPFFMLMMMVIHIILLHSTGSSNPMGSKEDMEKIEFQIMFTIKDFLFFSSIFSLVFISISNYPDIFMDPENMNEANPLKAPVHIQPEWYFLFAYAILRSITSKLGGVLALIFSILILFFIQIKGLSKVSGKFSPIVKLSFWIKVSSFLILTFVGMKPVELPFSVIGKVSSFLYFFI
uniref:Cytochrome b n=1 Tax=Steganacarus magnus TaxID=52000 RepID=B6Z5V4_9ACAR|nr:cytochrome b [Steganacarus magnus]ACH41155.1 cytochrome b [Steganacarus magnus]